MTRGLAPYFADTIMTTLTSGLHHATRRAIHTLRRWFDPPIEADSRPLEIRDAIVDRVEQTTEPAAAGRRVFPHNRVSVTVLAPDPGARIGLAAGLDDIDRAVRGRLAELRCPVPVGFEVEVQYTKKPKTDWLAGQRFAVEFESRAVTRRAQVREAAPPGLAITVLRGRAAETSYRLSESLVRIGRTPLPTDDTGRPRQNHIAFAEDGDAHSATVGRAHASIRYDGIKREYRLFDDGSHNGTRVVRGDTTLNVAGNPVGVRILSGDELQFGTAAVRIEIES
jgi:hypothetical protein